MSPDEAEFGPFPQFYLYITTDIGTVRHDISSVAEAVRLVSLVTNLVVQRPIPIPSPGEAPLGFSFAGSDPRAIKALRLIRADSILDVQRLPSVDDV